MKWTNITAWNLVPGDIVSWNGVRKVASNHWAPTGENTGIVTLVFTDGESVTMKDLTLVRHIGD